MKAVLLKDLDTFDLELVEKPDCPEKGILVKVLYCGLCGSDLRTIKSGHKNVRMPAILGHEVSGIVVETGKEYRGHFKIGDKIAVGPNVYCGKCEFCISGEFIFCINRKELAQYWQGGFAEYMAIPKEALTLGNIQLIPKGLDESYATIAEPAASCISAQEKLDIGLSDTVLIIGAGPIGCIHIALANARGAKKVIIADVNEERLNMCRIFKPDIILNVKKLDLVVEIKKITIGLGADKIITANPAAITQVQAVESSKRGGKIAFFGGLKYNDSRPNIDTNLIHYNSLTVIGTSSYGPIHFLNALELINTGKIPADKIVTHVLDIEDFHKGVDYALGGKSLKVVFKL